MLDNSALDNTRIPWPSLLGTLLGAVVIGAALVSLFPIGPGIGEAVVAILYGAFCSALLIAFGVILSEHFATVRTLRHGKTVAATVAHTKRTTWGMGTGGQSWHFTLRYEIDGRAMEQERSVPESVYQRCRVGTQVEVRVLPASPRRWAMPEAAASPAKAAAPLSPAQRRRQVPGAVAFALVSAGLAGTGIAAYPAGAMFMLLVLAAVALRIAWQWLRGEGRSAGGSFIGFLLIYLGTPMLAVALAPGAPELSVPSKVMWALLALAVAVVIAIVTMIIDLSSRDRV
jgi:hypothetical protein